MLRPISHDRLGSAIERILGSQNLMMLRASKPSAVAVTTTNGEITLGWRYCQEKNYNVVSSNEPRVDHALAKESIDKQLC